MTLSKDSIKEGLDEAALAWKTKHANEAHDGDMEACEDFEPKEAAADYLGIPLEDVNIMLEVTYQMANHIMPRIVLAGTLTGGDILEDLIQAGVDSAFAAFFVGMKQILDERAKNIANKYTATLMAEAQLNAYKAVGQDLSAVWPEAIVAEVAEQYTPGEAFLVGVMCGRAHG
jgi:hypothetical protein